MIIIEDTVSYGEITFNAKHPTAKHKLLIDAQ